MQTDMDDGKGSKANANGIHYLAIATDQKQREYWHVKPDEQLLTHLFRQRPKSRHDTPFPPLHCVEFVCEEQAEGQIVENVERQDNNTAIATTPHKEIIGKTTQYCASFGSSQPVAPRAARTAHKHTIGQ